MMWLIALLLGLLLPSAASAEPISTAIAVALASSSAGAGFGAAIAAGFGALSTTFVGKLIVGATLTLVGQLFRKKPKGIRDGGIQTEQTTTGDITPQKFVVGRYGLEGHAVAPAYSRGPNNRILTYILEFSNIPVQGLTGRVIIDGQYTDIGEPDVDGTRELLDLQSNGNARAWIRIYDGTQTTADAGLVEAYSDHPDRPWTTDHVLRGSAYAVLEFRRDQNIFPGLPSVRFEVDGIRLYDPREDSTVGGDGAQRWANPTTWTWTANPQVIKYNIFRGITLPTGDIYGGGSDAEDLPLDNWFAAMNECDVLIGDRPQFEAGFEINTNDMEPLDVIEEMDRSCFGQTSEFGGVWRTRTGAPGAPIMALTDDDFMITEASDTTLFPGLPQTFNAATGSFVDPSAVWESREADAVVNADWEAADGNRRLPRAINLPAVANNSQAQHLLESYLKDSRRFRTHSMTLPPSFALLEPLDTLTWTSDANGYDAKVFEMVEVEDRSANLTQRVKVREREAGDVAWTSGQDLPAPVGRLGVSLPDPAIPSITVSDLSIKDSLGVSRRAALLVEWPLGDVPIDALTLIVQVRVDPGLERVARKVARAADGEIEINDGILHATTYEVRARYVMEAPGEWSDWVSVTTGAGGFTAADLAADFSAKIDTAFDRHDAVLGDEGAPQSVADLLSHVRSGLGDGALPLLPTQPGAPMLDLPSGFKSLGDRFEAEVPLNFDRDAALDQIAETALSGLLKAGAAQSRIADAGVYVEPETGRVRIQADGLRGEAQLVVDGLNAQITQRVTYADLDQAIAEANFDPSQIADLEDVFLRLSSAETTLDAQAGEITDLTETLTVDGGVITMTEVTSRLNSVEGAITDFVTVTTFNAVEERVTTAEQELSAFDGARFRTVLSDVASLTDEADIDAETTLAGLIDSHRNRKALRSSAALARQDMWARADATDESVAGLSVDLAARFSESLALIQQESIARATEGTAIASDITALTTRIGDNESDIETIQSTKVDATGAVAAVSQTISAEYASFEALAEATSFARATVDGIVAGHVMRLNGQNVWEAVSVSDGTSGPIVTGRWSGDYLRLDGEVEVTGDFKVGGDNLFANTILAENIVANGITRFAVAGSGEIKNASATFTTIATATFEAPVDFKAQGILSFLLTNQPADYPNDVLFRALIQGTVVVNITKAGLLNANARRITLPVTLNNGVAAASVEIKFEVQNAGGLGAENSSYSVTGFLR